MVNSQSSSRRKKILLIEDDQFLIDIYKEKLEKEGFEVFVLCDGTKVLKKTKELKPDLILLDIVLPNQNGWEILKALKEDVEVKDIPVIILSNLAQEEEIQKGLALGAVKYLVKSQYVPSEIVEEIKRALL